MCTEKRIMDRHFHPLPACLFSSAIEPFEAYLERWFRKTLAVGRLSFI